ncbi:MAG: 30S ribosomal protein S20 [SAR324 cluster bacterium]|nr:30S ribosomal protein S20 [SAR324 cluster bacterium]
MAHHKSALKRIRQTVKQNLRNRSLRTNLRTAIKTFYELLENGDVEQIKKGYSQVQQSIDKAVSKGILHAKTASRKKSRLMHEVQKKTA